MTHNIDAFKSVMGHFPAGVTVVTIKAGEEIHGCTVSAFTSISADPALIMISINNDSRSGQLLQQEGAKFGVNILAADQADISNQFAWVKTDNKFELGKWTTAVTDAPILENALAWLDCTIHSTHLAGTHTLYIGKVEACQLVRPDEAPLVYWNRKYRDLVLDELVTA
ncbi:MAG: flavin reductase family protein [Chloroflexota bacterium]